MKTNFADQIIKFCSDSLRTITPVTPYSRHLDEILGCHNVQELELNDMLDIYLFWVQHLIAIDLPAKPVLVIPLISESFIVQMNVPTSITDLRNQMDSFEPSSLILVDWQHNRFAAPCEEYCYPLDFQLFTSSQDHIYIYYREFRYLMGKVNKWEFSRAIYAEYYPNKLVIQ